MAAKQIAQRSGLGETAVCTRTLTGHTNSARVVAFHPGDADLLASGSDDKHIKVWKVTTGGIVYEYNKYLQILCCARLVWVPTFSLLLTCVRSNAMLHCSHFLLLAHAVATHLLIQCLPPPSPAPPQPHQNVLPLCADTDRMLQTLLSTNQTQTCW